jgi:hypothetical protein
VTYGRGVVETVANRAASIGAKPLHEGPLLVAPANRLRGNREALRHRAQLPARVRREQVDDDALSKWRDALCDAGDQVAAVRERPVHVEDQVLELDRGGAWDLEAC